MMMAPAPGLPADVIVNVTVVAVNSMCIVLPIYARFRNRM